MSEITTNEIVPAVKATQVHKAFGNLHVLKGIDMTVMPGTVTVILGPSGSGKSTFLRLINQLETLTGGEIDVDGEMIGYKYVDKGGERVLQTLNDKEVAEQRSKLGMVFQRFNLFPHMTALENVMEAPVHVKHMDKKEARELAIQELNRVGMGERLDYYPAQLSGGQQQRVAIARALATNPKIILCDEATSALDPTTTTSILNLLREINRKMGITIVIITHEMSVVESTCTHVAIIDDGRLAECGTVESVFSQPKSAAAKKLIFRTTGADSGAMGERMIRIVFEGSSADEPTISDLAMQCHVAVNIRYADTREVSGKLFGQMILQLPEDHLQQEKAIYFLQNKGLRVEEVTDRVHG